MVGAPSLELVVSCGTHRPVRGWIWAAQAQVAPPGCHRLHHARVAAVRFADDDAIVVSAAAAGEGGAPFVIWDVAKRAPLCGQLYHIS